MAALPGQNRFPLPSFHESAPLDDRIRRARPGASHERSLSWILNPKTHHHRRWRTGSAAHGDHDCGAEAVAQLQHQVIEPLGSDRIQPCRRLIEEENFRVKGERSSQSRALAHPARKLGRHSISGRGQSHERKLEADQNGDCVGAEAREQLQRQRHVFGDRHRTPERAALKQYAEMATNLHAARLGRAPVILAIHHNRPRRGVQQADHGLQTVLLPQPLPPMSAKIDPWRTEKLRSRWIT